MKEEIEYCPDCYRKLIEINDSETGENIKVCRWCDLTIDSDGGIIN